MAFFFAMDEEPLLCDMEVVIERARQARKSADPQQEIAWELLAKAKQAAKKLATKRLTTRILL